MAPPTLGRPRSGQHDEWTTRVAYLCLRRLSLCFPWQALRALTSSGQNGTKSASCWHLPWLEVGSIVCRRGDVCSEPVCRWIGTYPIIAPTVQSAPVFDLKDRAAVAAEISLVLAATFWGLNFARSEERRVGKECRSRW